MFAARDLTRGESLCEYEGELCALNMVKERHEKYNLSGEGSYILEFRFRDNILGIENTIKTRHTKVGWLLFL